jgi:uncharacterized protein (TIGR02996 family)
MSKAIESNWNGVFGKFACVYGGLRTQEFSHDDAKSFTASIADNPTDETGWLALADRLEDEGNAAHHMIRILFDASYEAPAGFKGEINRGGNYFENGQTYTENRCVSWGEDGDHYEFKGFTHHYWSNGNWRAPISRQEAIAMLTKEGGPRVAKWLNLRITGVLKPRARVVAAGKEVIVTRPGSDKAVNHTLATTIEIPADHTHTYPSWGGRVVNCIEFLYMGHTVTVLIRDIEAVA